jgi:hypothetical protein
MTTNKTEPRDLSKLTTRQLKNELEDLTCADIVYADKLHAVDVELRRRRAAAKDRRAGAAA